jgi:hypothetical protein
MRTRIDSGDAEEQSHQNIEFTAMITATLTIAALLGAIICLRIVTALAPSNDSLYIHSANITVRCT